MKYNDFQDIKLSALGMGCMRFPVIDGKFDQIDLTATEEMISYAMKNGINYYDTAWGYHDGKSELVMGKLLKNYPRESFYLATKFPGYDLSNMDKVQEVFERQLEKCEVEYFDFYLLHNVCEMNIDAYLDPKYGIVDYLLEQKKQGRIRHLGFSAHGTLETMKRLLDAYGEYMEFCQIQLNWLDWSFQNAKGKVELLASYNIPVWVMEPVRGGSLAKLSEEHEAMLKAVQPDWSIPEWAFRFLHSMKGVAVTLSGMSNLEQLKENIAVYDDVRPLTEEEMDVLMKVAKEKISKGTLPCTGCRYCTSYCPQELNIPWLIELYNEHIYSGGSFITNMGMTSLPEDKKPSACIGCRSCEAVCPQNIRISEAMADFAAGIK